MTTDTGSTTDQPTPKPSPNGPGLTSASPAAAPKSGSVSRPPAPRSSSPADEPPSVPPAQTPPAQTPLANTPATTMRPDVPVEAARQLQMATFWKVLATQLEHDKRPQAQDIKEIAALWMRHPWSDATAACGSDSLGKTAGPRRGNPSHPSIRAWLVQTQAYARWKRLLAQSETSVPRTKLPPETREDLKKLAAEIRESLPKHRSFSQLFERPIPREAIEGLVEHIEHLLGDTAYRMQDDPIVRLIESKFASFGPSWPPVRLFKAIFSDPQPKRDSDTIVLELESLGSALETAQAGDPTGYEGIEASLWDGIEAIVLPAPSPEDQTRGFRSDSRVNSALTLLNAVLERSQDHDYKDCWAKVLEAIKSLMRLVSPQLTHAIMPLSGRLDPNHLSDIERHVTIEWVKASDDPANPVAEPGQVVRFDRFILLGHELSPRPRWQVALAPKRHVKVFCTRPPRMRGEESPVLQSWWTSYRVQSLTNNSSDRSGPDLKEIASEIDTTWFDHFCRADQSSEDVKLWRRLFEKNGVPCYPFNPDSGLENQPLPGELVSQMSTTWAFDDAKPENTVISVERYAPTPDGAECTVSRGPHPEYYRNARLVDEALRALEHHLEAKPAARSACGPLAKRIQAFQTEVDSVSHQPIQISDVFDPNDWPDWKSDLRNLMAAALPSGDRSATATVSPVDDSARRVILPASEIDRPLAESLDRLVRAMAAWAESVGGRVDRGGWTCAAGAETAQRSVFWPENDAEADRLENGVGLIDFVCGPADQAGEADLVRMVKAPPGWHQAVRAVKAPKDASKMDLSDDNRKTLLAALEEIEAKWSGESLDGPGAQDHAMMERDLKRHRQKLVIAFDMAIIACNQIARREGRESPISGRQQGELINELFKHLNLTSQSAKSINDLLRTSGVFHQDHTWQGKFNDYEEVHPAYQEGDRIIIEGRYRLRNVEKPSKSDSPVDV